MLIVIFLLKSRWTSPCCSPGPLSLHHAPCLALCFLAATLHGRPHVPGTPWSARHALQQTAVGRGSEMALQPGLWLHTSLKPQGAPGLGTFPACPQASDPAPNTSLRAYPGRHAGAAHDTFPALIALKALLKGCENQSLELLKTDKCNMMWTGPQKHHRELLGAGAARHHIRTRS